ncbi:glutathione synthase [bacterium SCSIO 12741]|nr:glutathione synthase [bacterium SCSIO 12741]
MNICFIMYPWEQADDRDSTVKMVHEAALRKHTVAITTPGALTIRNSVTSAFCQVVIKADKVASKTSAFFKKVRFRDQLLPLAGFDIIFMRANPPIDNIALNFLDSVRNDVFIVNDIQGLREANNKLYTAAFDDPNNEIIPVTHVSKNKTYLKKVIQESKSERMIMKPLNGMGGSGVIVIEKNATQNINSLLDFYIAGKDGEKSYVIIQEFVEGAEQGDVRVLMLNGKPMGAFRRVPAKDDIRSNLSAGGRMEKHHLTRQEKKVCEIIGPKLVADGLYFVGLDIINGKLIEVNVCSPGGVVAISNLNRTNIAAKILDFAEGVVVNKEEALKRKAMFRQTVDNA